MKQKSKKLRVGFIGCGRISHLHILGYRNNFDAELTALCNRGNVALEKAAKEWGIAKTYTDYRQLLEDKDIDLVEILTPHSCHKQIALDAAAAGKHISLQKVPTLTLADYDQVIKAVDKAGVRFRVYENFRFHPPYQKAMEIIQSGAIGKVVNVNQRMWVGLDRQSLLREIPGFKTWLWRMKEEEDYNLPTVFDDGYHKHSIASMFLGEPITHVQTWSNFAKLEGVYTLDSPTVVIYKTANPLCYGIWNTSIIPSLHIASDYYSSDEMVEITGTEGVILIYGCTGNMFDSASVQKPGIYWMGKNGKWHTEVHLATNWEWSFIRCTQHFIEAIKNNTEAHLNAAEGRDILRLTLAVVKSMKHGGQDVVVSDVEQGRIQ